MPQIIPIRDLKNTSQISQKCHSVNEPIFITKNGYGDMVMRPDLDTLHRQPWQPGTVGVLCDLETEEGDPVAPSPRQVLRKQLDRLRDAGYGAFWGEVQAEKRAQRAARREAAPGVNGVSRA